MYDYFGHSRLFLTIALCDECKFWVRLFVDADKPHMTRDNEYWKIN